MTEIDAAIKQERVKVEQALRDAGLSWADGESVLNTWADNGYYAALGKVGVYKARYKARAEKLPVKLKQTTALDSSIEQGKARLRARYGDDEAVQLFNRWIDEVAPMTGTGGSVAVTDSGRQSVVPTKQKAFDPATDAFAIAAGADQVRSKR